MKIRTITPARTALVAAATAALLGSMLVVSPAQAATNDQTDPKTAEALQAGVTESSRTFDGAVARSEGASTADIEDFATGWTIAGGTVQNAPVDRDLVQAVAARADVILACTGKNRWDYTGLQLNVYLNSCNTNKLLGAIATGAGATVAVGIITGATGLGAAAAGIIAAGLGVAGGILTICAANGRGVAIHNIAPGPVVWCNGQ